MWKILCLGIALMQWLSMAESFVESSNFAKDSKELVNINGSVFYFSPAGWQVSFDRALTTCLDMDMRLLSLQNAEKQKMIGDYLTANNFRGDIWTSGIRYYGNSSSTFIWSSTGEKVEYTNWITDRPDILHYQNLCISLRYSYDYQWKDIDCDYSFIAIICEEKTQC